MLRPCAPDATSGAGFPNRVCSCRSKPPRFFTCTPRAHKGGGVPQFPRQLYLFTKGPTTRNGGCEIRIIRRSFPFERPTEGTFLFKEWACPVSSASGSDRPHLAEAPKLVSSGGGSMPETEPKPFRKSGVREGGNKQYQKGKFDSPRTSPGVRRHPSHINSPGVESARVGGRPTRDGEQGHCHTTTTVRHNRGWRGVVPSRSVGGCAPHP